MVASAEASIIRAPRILRRPRNLWFFVAAAFVFVALAVVVFYVLPSWLIDGDDFTLARDRAKAENDVRTTGVQLLAGLALGLGALFTAITLIYNREAQITERFTRAIDQLGHEEPEVRVGGIYALERIMRDSPRDHGPIVETLMSFVREHAKPPTPVLPATGNEKPSADVQAAVTVLGRRKHRPTEELDALRLSGTFLRGALLRRALFLCARLRDARLEHTHLELAQLEGAMLDRARLDHADLEGANLNHASLIDASMFAVNLKDASLVGAHLAGVTGNPSLSEKQQTDAHCLSEIASCDAELPENHPCRRYEPA